MHILRRSLLLVGLTIGGDEEARRVTAVDRLLIHQPGNRSRLEQDLQAVASEAGRLVEEGTRHGISTLMDRVVRQLEVLAQHGFADLVVVAHEADERECPGDGDGRFAPAGCRPCVGAERHDEVGEIVARP